MVFLHSSIELYGSDRMLLNVIDTLPEGWTAEVWLPDDVPFLADGLPAELTARGVDWTVRALPVLRRRYLRPLPLIGMLSRAAALRGQLRRARPDMVYVATSALLLAAPVARLAGFQRTVLHAQEIWAGTEGRILAALARSVSDVVCISEPVRVSLSAPVRRRARVIANAVPDSAEPIVDRSEVDGPLRYVVASRWNAWKGHETLLNAWRAAGEPGHLTILGGPPPIGAAVDVPALVRDLGIGGSVTIGGEVASVRPYLDDVDVMIVPSDQPEPFGLVAIEAFCRSRPVIGSDGGGLADIVGDGETGWLYPLRDVSALAAVLSSVGRDDALERGRNAREAYLHRYAPSRYAAEFASVWAAGG
ncbi:glycosyltransferase family 4 protein [Naasia lichenicola]|uniref:Glycosyltransferase family 4 protein n=1 Tax=Naasia lichenicola TaxID=2565933 RepID=A0A4S4FKV8_9MICO|nr:glycosyltransferase family 4 protein [Naasia lichenicola]THG30801.1 glycosyltransferase family 4 protein [Naasia lichenicola]